MTVKGGDWQKQRQERRSEQSKKNVEQEKILENKE